MKGDAICNPHYHTQADVGDYCKTRDYLSEYGDRGYTIWKKAYKIAAGYVGTSPYFYLKIPQTYTYDSKPVGYYGPLPIGRSGATE